MSNIPNRRNLVDVLSQVTKALPAAAANNDTDEIYIGGEGPHREGLKLRVDVPETPALVDTKTIVFTLADGATGATATSNPGQTYTITGVNTPGADAVTFYFDIPQGAGEYILVNQAVETGGGDNTGVTVTYSLVS